MYKEDGNLDAVFLSVVESIRETLPKLTMDADRFGDYSRVRTSIVPRLVNREANKKMLADAPHIEFLDLAIAFHIFVPKDEIPVKTGGNGAILVRNEMMEAWGVSTNELYQTAKGNGGKNTPALDP